MKRQTSNSIRQVEAKAKMPCYSWRLTYIFRQASNACGSHASLNGQRIHRDRLLASLSSTEVGFGDGLLKSEPDLLCHRRHHTSGAERLASCARHHKASVLCYDFCVGGKRLIEVRPQPHPKKPTRGSDHAYRPFHN